VAARREFCLWPFLAAGWPAYALITAYVRLALDIRLRRSARIGGGLYIGHLGGISLRSCRLGRHCSISQEVRIEPGSDWRGPAIGNRVWIGAQARIVGLRRVGDGSTISAAAVLQQDVPENVLCMGKPARVLIRGYDNSAILNVVDVPAR